MINSRKFLFSALVLLSGCAFAFQIDDLESGFYRYSGEMSDQQRNLIWDLEDIASSQAGNDFRSISSVVKAGDGSVWAVLSSTLRLGVIDKASSSIIGSWPLVSWKNAFVESEISRALESYNLKNYFDETGLKEGELGCFSSRPLRYGDINKDDIDELVLFLGNTMLIFSPEKEAVIFSSELGIEDWLNSEDTLAHLESWGPQPPGDNDPQYQSRLAKESVSTWSGRFPGYRGYAKLYFDDFDRDGSQDILVWRKLYVSRLRGDSMKGFKHARGTLLHYSLKDGEYKLVDSEDSMIRGWLRAGDFTWKKGFPSKSECAGEEEELIPEMHDPLLNDPDVLQ